MTYMTMSRRRFLICSAVVACIPPAIAAPASAPSQLVEVWKEPTCGCCGDWIKHMETNGFAVRVRDTGNAAVRKRLGLPAKYGSCHTAVIGGYVVEGHVPAQEIQRLLREQPQGVVGLAVPGMPVGSPGMDGPSYKGRKDHYDVLLVQRDGSSSVYQSYP